jgi:hypothetical protein
MYRMPFSVCVFVVASLFGPLIRLLTPYANFDGSVSDRISRFVYDLVLLLWPAQPVAVMEASIGRLAATMLALGANVLLFGVIGFVVGMSPKRGVWVASYVSTCVLVLWVGLWGDGFSVAHFNWFAFVVALTLYAVPFWVAARTISPKKQ